MATIPNFTVIGEELAKNSPEITRLPKMGPAQWWDGPKHADDADGADDAGVVNV